jgi:hypothetical protein
MTAPRPRLEAGRARQGLEATRARRRQGKDKRDTLANAPVLPCSMTFRAGG